MSLQSQIFVLMAIVTIQPVIYGLATFYLITRMFHQINRTLESFGAELGQLKLDKAGQQDVQSEIEHSLDYLSRQIAQHQEMYGKITFLHMWVSRLDGTLTLLNMNISSAVDLIRASTLKNE